MKYFKIKLVVILVSDVPSQTTRPGKTLYLEWELSFKSDLDQYYDWL